jgi:LPXTG-motif cell wall-anchored protein
MNNNNTRKRIIRLAVASAAGTALTIAATAGASSAHTPIASCDGHVARFGGTQYEAADYQIDGGPTVHFTGEFHVTRPGNVAHVLVISNSSDGVGNGTFHTPVCYTEETVPSTTSPPTTLPSSTVPESSTTPTTEPSTSSVPSTDESSTSSTTSPDSTSTPATDATTVPDSSLPEGCLSINPATGECNPQTPSDTCVNGRRIGDFIPCEVPAVVEPVAEPAASVPADTTPAGIAELGSPEPVATVAPQPTTLPATGIDTGLQLAIGLAAVSVGTAFAVVARRRPRRHV